MAQALDLSLPNDTLHFGQYGGRLISQSGKIDRDLTLLSMKQRAGFNPWFIIGGDTIFITRYPKLENKPLYLFDQLSGELQNLRLNGMVNFSDFGFAQINYQINGDLILDGFATLGNLDKSPFFLTVGKQYIPYGDFNKFEAEVNPLNKTIFRIDQQAATLSYYDKVTLLRTSLIKNKDYGDQAFALSAERHFKHNDTNFRISSGFFSNLNNMTKPLRALDISHQQVPAFDVYTIITHHPYRMRVEITQALKSFTYTQKLGAYNIDSQYQTTLYQRPLKFSFAVSGLYNIGHLKQDPAFDKLGLFTHQFVFSVKHRLHKQVFMGLSMLIGKQRSYQSQGVLDLVIKV